MGHWYSQCPIEDTDIKTKWHRKNLPGSLLDLRLNEGVSHVVGGVGGCGKGLGYRAVVEVGVV
jgi:hypothetical protein